MKKINMLVAIYTLLLSACFSVSGSTCIARPSQVTPQEEAAWLRWVIPLPKRISIKEKIELVNSDIKIQVSDKTGDVGKKAAAKLIELLKIDPNNNITKFEILIGICDTRGKVGDLILPEAAKLSDLPNKNQAYYITPIDGNRLIITALDEKGLLYGAITLRSLIKGKLNGKTATLPLVKVFDWPDIAKRGRWGRDGFHAPIEHDIKWMIPVKMNFMNRLNPFKFSKKPICTFTEENIKQARYCRLNAINYIPIIIHMDRMINECDLLKAYPDLQGKTVTARDKSEHMQPVCCSNPKLTQLMADCMKDMVKRGGITDILCFLSEHRDIQCKCDKCKATNQYVAETRVFLNAWRIAKKEYPYLGIQILLTQGSYAYNDKIFAEVPKEVGMVYYSGKDTYNTTKKEMIYPFLTEFAANGGWLGCYPTANANWRIVAPFSCPQFIKYRALEFYNKKLKSITWHVTPSRNFYDFNLKAAAEWSWNATGRDEHKFAAAWATQNGCESPDIVADWAVMMGPISWNLYGSDIPYKFIHNKIHGMLKRNDKPVLGQDIFRYWETIEDFEKDIAVTKKALELAKSLNSPPLINETLVVQGYIKMAKAIYLLTKQLTAQKPATPEAKLEMQKNIEKLGKACLQTTTALKNWTKPIPLSSPVGERRIRDTIKSTERTALALADAVEKYGIKNNMQAYISGEVTELTEDDKAEAELMQ